MAPLKQDMPVSTNPNAQRLRELLFHTGAIQYSPDRPFQLTSGATSHHYFDLKLLNGNPEGINTVAKIRYGYIKDIGAKSVGGLESGSIPISTAVSQLSYTEHLHDPQNPLINSFYVRKKIKEHGAQKLIEGVIQSPAVVIDDVITSGGSALKAVRAVREEGHECLLLLCIIFR